MNGTSCHFAKYMSGDSKRFVIPVYQRNYDWKTDNCKQLYDDLVKIIRNDRKSHFFGSIVSVYNPDGIDEEYLVIDGQQRLTTVSLLFLAMYNLMDRGIVEAAVVHLKEKILKTYLIDQWKPEDTRIKLKPIKNDRDAYKRLFEKDHHIGESRLTANYEYFYERIQKQEITIDQLYEAICRLEIINIKLDHEDDPQLIFESLNSTGLELSEGDKIRNFILMGLPTAVQEKYYNEYWNRIEAHTKYDVSSFIRDYLSVKQNVTPPQKKIYAAFKEYVISGDIETLALLEDIRSYAEWYQILLDGNTASKELNGCIMRLNRLETTVTRPFFLEVLRLCNNNILSLSETTEVFRLTETYLLRRSICDLPANSLGKIFLLLHREIVRYDGTASNYVEKLKYALLSKREKARFPSDSEFVDAFRVKPIYSMNSKNKLYILERFENSGTAEDKDVYRHYDDGTYSIEHIMPQHLTPAWQKELGENYESVHEQWLHRIANLTLTAYNSKYSNSSFSEKKTTKNGYNDSGIRMNNWIAKKAVWTLTELEERSDYMMSRALEIWPLLTTEFKPAEKQLDAYTLEDEEELTGRMIAKFVFKNAEQPVTSWAEMYQKVLEILYTEDKSIITKLAISEDDNLSNHFSTRPDAFENSAAIGDVYVWVNRSTQNKLSVLNRLFALYGENPVDLVFYLRDESEPDEDEHGSRFELRRRFWASALPIITGAFGNTGPFSGVSPSKENWVNGYFGIDGFKLCCVANHDGARVELHFGKAEKAENRKAFDNLERHKAEIEEALNTSLVWDRGDEDRKSSKVYAQLSNVSIKDETDWSQLAKFHAEWSKKFYDVLVPLVTN